MLEVDERSGHDHAVPFVADRAKDRYAATRGFLPLRCTDADIAIRPRELAAELRQALDSRS